MSYNNPKNSSHALSKEASIVQNSIILWLLFFLITFILFWAPFQKGLFNGNSFDFERPIYTSSVWAFTLLFLLSIYLFYQFRLKDTSSLLSIFVWLIPLTLVPPLKNTSSHYYAYNVLLIDVTYAIFFLITFYVARARHGLDILRRILLVSSYSVVYFGLFNWLGQKEAIYKWVSWFAVEMKNINFYQDAVMTDSNGVRLTSVFQYANSYSAFLIALLLVCLFLVTSSTKWYSVIIHGFMTVPIIVSFFLTLSRGGLVVLPVVMLVVLPFLKPSRQILFILHTVLTFGFSLLILNRVTEAGIQLSKQYNSSISAEGWLTLLGASLVAASAAFVIQKFLAPWIHKNLDKLNNFRFANIVLPVTSIVACFAGIILLFNTGVINLLPDNVRTRVENINFQQHSVLERGTFYKDAVKLFQDYPVFGAGGGAWSALYEKYQNNPYVSRQAHNFFLQYLVETGIVGMTILLLFLFAVFWIFIRSHRNNGKDSSDRRMVFYIVAVSLLIHSMIDFDLSYVYLGILLFLSLGAMISGNMKELKGHWVDSVNKYRWVYPSFLLICSILMFFQTTQLLSGNTNFKNATALAQAQKPVNEIFASLDKAIEKNPGHPDYVGYKIDILLQLYNQNKEERFYSEALSLIQQVRQTESHNRILIEKEIYAYQIKNELDKALALVNAELPNFPWDITLYEKNVALNLSLGDKARTEKNDQKKEQYWNQAFETYNKVLEKQQILAALPKEQQQGRPFNVTKVMGLALGQIEFMRGNLVNAEKLLVIGLDVNAIDDATSRQQLRWFLAALQKQGRLDQALMDKLIAKDPNERQEVQNLASATF
jgi:tetratricopeptide (TPR) repeat protein